MIALETPSAASAQEIPQLFGGRPGHQGARSRTAITEATTRRRCSPLFRFIRSSTNLSGRERESNTFICCYQTIRKILYIVEHFINTLFCFFYEHTFIFQPSKNAQPGLNYLLFYSFTKTLQTQIIPEHTDETTEN